MVQDEGFTTISLPKRSIGPPPLSRSRAGVGGNTQTTRYQGKVSVWNKNWRGKPTTFKCGIECGNWWWKKEWVQDGIMDIEPEGYPTLEPTDDPTLTISFTAPISPYKFYLSGHLLKTSDQKSDILDPPVQHRRFRWHPPDPVHGHPDRIARKRPKHTKMYPLFRDVVRHMLGGLEPPNKNLAPQTKWSALALIGLSLYFLLVQYYSRKSPLR